jgi:RNA polymerase sigma factor (sigma-70 family)
MPDKTAIGPGDITVLLERWARDGDQAAANELVPLVTPQLRKLARYLLNRETPGHHLRSMDLVQEGFLRLLHIQNQSWPNRRYFYAFFARAMRRHLIDYWRKHGPVEIKPLPDDPDFPIPAPGVNLDQEILISELLDQLAQIEPVWCMVVEFKYYLQPLKWPKC